MRNAVRKTGLKHPDHETFVSDTLNAEVLGAFVMWEEHTGRVSGMVLLLAVM